jgi:polyphosphate kinase 2 (PPK2 family)
VLQVELVKLQRHFIRCQDRILVVLEGRDAAGKDGSIKRIVEYLSPRETRVVALGKPSDRERSGWYFQRYVPHLPVAEELVLFNRSWYNRPASSTSWASAPRNSMQSSCNPCRSSRRCWSDRASSC